jgi:hypothetical protein
MIPPSKNISKIEKHFQDRKTFPGKDRRSADLSTALRSGRDDKGKGGAPIDSGC